MYIYQHKAKRFSYILYFVAFCAFVLNYSMIRTVITSPQQHDKIATLVALVILCLPFYVGIAYFAKNIRVHRSGTQRLARVFQALRRSDLAAVIILVIAAWPMGLYLVIIRLLRPIYQPFLSGKKPTPCGIKDSLPLPASWNVANNSFSALSLQQRLEQWVILAHERPREEDPIIQAGEEGERKAIQTLRRTKLITGAELFVGKRVPKVKNHPLIKSSRSELDIIILTHRRIHVIEVKNWSGRISPGPDETKWTRTKRNNPDSSRDVDNPVMLNSAKALSLKNYLQSIGIDIPYEHFQTNLFLVNNNVVLDPAIKNIPDVITATQVSGFARTLGFGGIERVLLRMVRVVLEREHADTIAHGFGAFSEETRRKLSEAIHVIPTWDKLTFFGGVTHTGDILALTINGQSCTIKDLAQNQCMRFSWRRNRVYALVCALLGMNIGAIHDGHRKIPCCGVNEVLFHFAGQPKPEIVPLTAIDWLQKG